MTAPSGGGHFDPPLTDAVEGTLAFPVGKVPHLAGAPRTCSDLRRALRSQGGFDSTASFVRVTIKALLPVDIQIKKLEPRLLGQRTSTHVVPVDCVPAPGPWEAAVPEDVALNSGVRRARPHLGVIAWSGATEPWPAAPLGTRKAAGAPTLT